MCFCFLQRRNIYILEALILYCVKEHTRNTTYLTLHDTGARPRTLHVCRTKDQVQPDFPFKAGSNPASDS